MPVMLLKSRLPSYDTDTDALIRSSSYVRDDYSSSIAKGAQPFKFYKLKQHAYPNRNPTSSVDPFLMGMNESIGASSHAKGHLS